MNGIVTEELIYLDSDEDEDPLRLSPLPSPRPSTSKELRSEMQRRFANLQKPTPTPGITLVPVILANARKRVAPTRIGEVGPKKLEIIDVIDLDPPSPPTHAPNHQTHSSKKRPQKDDQKSTQKKLGSHAPAASTPTNAHKDAPNCRTPTSSHSLNKRPGKDDIDSTMNKLVGSQATNHDIFVKFLEICTACDPDCNVIMDKKTKPYYTNIDPIYAASQEFRFLLEEKISIMAKNPAFVFNILINVHDEMKHHKLKQDGKKPKLDNKAYFNKPSTSSSSNKPSTSSYFKEASTSSKEDNNRESDNGKAEENSKEARKKKKMEAHIKMLEKAQYKCHVKIKRLEEKEVDWDDDSNSVYLELQSFRKKCIEIHRKLSQLKGVRDESRKAPARIACVSPYPHVSLAIEKYISSNRKFPDFCDILKLYKDAKIGLRPVDLHAQAETSFKEIGNQIQKLRQVYDWNLACVFLGSEPDPAEDDPKLMEKLKNNKKLGDSKLDEVMASFTRRQYEMKLEPAEVTDEQAAKSDSSEDDDDEDERSEASDASRGLRERLSDLSGEDDDDDDDDDDDRSTSQTTDTTKAKKRSKRAASEDSLSDSETPRGKKRRREKSPSKAKDPVRKKKIVLDTALPTDQLWSFTEDAIMAANMKKSQATTNYPPSTETKPPLPKQTELQPVPPTPTTANVNIVSPLRKFQEETLMTYLEITYKMDPSAINAKLVSSSSQSKCTKSTVGIVDSTDWTGASQSRSRLEKTASDPEVTSTSVEGEPGLAAKVDVSAQTVSDFRVSGCAERGTAADVASTSGKEGIAVDLHGGSTAEKKNKTAGTGSGKEQPSEADVSEVIDRPVSVVRNIWGKSGIDLSKEAVKKTCRKAEVFMTGSELPTVVCASSIKNAGGDQVSEVGGINLNEPVCDKTDVDEILSAELESTVEEEVVGCEEPAEADGGSVNEDLGDTEDWESMITPTLVAKDVLVVPTNGSGDEEETEIETTTELEPEPELDLNSSVECLQVPPVIKTYERKGPKTVPSKKSLEGKEPGQSSTAVLEVNSSNKLVDQSPKTAISKRTCSETLLTEPEEKKFLIARLTTPSELEQGRSDEVRRAPPAKAASEQKGTEKVSLRKEQAEEATISKAAAAPCVPATFAKFDASLVKKSKTVTDETSDSNTSVATSSRSSSSRGNGISESKPSIDVIPPKRPEALKVAAPIKDPLRAGKPTARKSFPGKAPVLKNSTTQLPGSTITQVTVSGKDRVNLINDRKKELISVVTNRLNARKSFMGESY